MAVAELIQLQGHHVVYNKLEKEKEFFAIPWNILC